MVRNALTANDDVTNSIVGSIDDTIYKARALPRSLPTNPSLPRTKSSKLQVCIGHTDLDIRNGSEADISLVAD